jgi:hypothetical protein
VQIVVESNNQLIITFSFKLVQSLVLRLYTETMKIIPLLFSDLSYGTHEYGFLVRKPAQDSDDEDAHYQRHLKNQGVEARVWDGKVKIVI